MIDKNHTQFSSLFSYNLKNNKIVFFTGYGKYGSVESFIKLNHLTRYMKKDQG